MEPELLYTNRKEIVQKLSNELNLPTIYLYNTQNNSFLDDIILFSKIDESYISNNIQYTEQNIQDIIKGKDISKGIIIFTNETENIESILQTVKKATNLEKYQHLTKLNSCNIYYFYSPGIETTHLDKKQNK